MQSVECFLKLIFGRLRRYGINILVLNVNIILWSKRKNLWEL